MNIFLAGLGVSVGVGLCAVLACTLDRVAALCFRSDESLVASASEQAHTILV